MYFRPIFDLFYPLCPKPTFDLFLTYFNVFGVRGPLGGLLLLKPRFFREERLSSLDTSLATIIRDCPCEAGDQIIG